MTNIRKNRIGIKALGELRARYRSELWGHYDELKRKLQEQYEGYIRLFMLDIPLEKLRENMVLSYGNKLEISLFRESSADKLCGGVKGIVCPLLDEKERLLVDLDDQASEAVEALDEWYHASLKPADFSDFDIGEWL